MGKLSRLEIKTLRRKQNIVSRYLASLVITTVVVVASFSLFRPLEARITNIQLLETEMYVSTFVIPNDDLVQGSLKITLESTSTYQEAPITIGESMGYFNELIYGRTYKIKIKGDVGYGIQTFHEQTYYLRKAINVAIDFDQYQHTISYSVMGNDIFNIIPTNTFYVDIYDDKTFIQRDTFVIDESRSLYGNGSVLDIKADGYTYRFVIKYDYRGGEATLYESDFKTSTLPVIEGEVYGGLDFISYYLLVTDFAFRIKNPLVLVKIEGSDYLFEETIDIETSPVIQNMLEGLALGYYTFSVYIDLGNGLESYYKAYVEVGGMEQTWLN